MHLHLWIPTVHADSHRALGGHDRATAVAVADSAHAGAALLAVTEAAQRLGVRVGMLSSDARTRGAGLVVRAADARAGASHPGAHRSAVRGGVVRRLRRRRALGPRLGERPPAAAAARGHGAR